MCGGCLEEHGGVPQQLPVSRYASAFHLATTIVPKIKLVVSYRGDLWGETSESTEEPEKKVWWRGCEVTSGTK